MQLKMAENQVQETIQNSPTCMTSVNRVVSLPVVESTINVATDYYNKVKDFNDFTKKSFDSVEQTINTVVETGKPYAVSVAKSLDGPIKTVDGVLCTGLDYVESKVPAVKLPPGELILQMYTSTKDYVQDTVTPAVGSAYQKVHDAVQPAVESTMHLVDPALQAAKQVVDPAVQAVKPTVEMAYKMVEPVVQPAVDKAQALKDYGVQKVEELLHKTEISSSTHEEGEVVECKECQEHAESQK